MSDLRDLYQEVILDHTRRPRNFGTLANANREAKGHNPLCGDQVSVYLRMEGDRIEDIAFQGSGCAISTASASLMTEALKGLTTAEARELFHGFHFFFNDTATTESLGKLAVFSGVREYPIRVKCATLAWHAVQAALDQQDHPVTAPVTAPVTTE